MRREDAEAEVAQLAARFGFGKAGAAGAAFGAPGVNLFPTGQIAGLGVTPVKQGNYRVTVQVTSRRAKALAEQTLAGGRKGGRDVEVELVGKMVAQPAAAGSTPSNGAWSGPLRVGDSAAHYLLTAGTIGPYVELPGTQPVSQRTGVLSCNHVFLRANTPLSPTPPASNGSGYPADFLIRPGRLDGGKYPADAFGVLAQFRPLLVGGVNEVDAAVGRITETNLIPSDPNQIPDIGVIRGANSEPGYLADLTIPDELFKGAKEPTWPVVRKRGRTTGVKEGYVVQPGAKAWVRYELPGGPELTFADVLYVRRRDGRPFAEKGDSGAAVVTEDMTCIGIVFAVSEHSYSPKNPATTYVIPIQSVLTALKVKLL